jgi:hypothetical protein
MKKTVDKTAIFDNIKMAMTNKIKRWKLLEIYYIILKS